MSEPIDSGNSRQYSEVRKHRPLWALGFVALVYAVQMIVTGVLLDESQGYSMSAIGYPTAIAAMVMAGGWSVLGVGNVLVRSVVAILLATIVLLGLLIGIEIFEGIIGYDFFGEGYLFQLTLILSFFTIAVFIQIPFWLLRGLAGWNWCFDDAAENPTISLRDMFLVMMMFCLAVSASQWGTRLIVAQTLSNIEVGDSIYVGNERGDTNGFLNITQENVEQVREEQLAETFLQVPLVSTLFFIVPAVFVLPLFWWVFRCKRILTSWFASMLYSFPVSGLALLIMYALGGLDGFDLEMIGQIFLFVAATCLLVWFPLVMLRRSGFVLRTKRTLLNPTRD